jgi:hypothetical protein
LHSKSTRFPAFLLLILIGVAAWIGCIFYTLYLNPEVRLFKWATQVKRAWVLRLTEKYPQKTVVYGGSSCTFSIDAKYATENGGVPMANLGLGAGLGARVLTRYALSETRPGDTLMVSLEPALLMDDLVPPHLGVQISTAIGHPEFAANTDIGEARSVPWLSMPAALRPGGYHVFTMLGKLVRRQPIYRYKPSDFQEDGRQRTAVRIPPESPGDPGHVSAQGKKFLESLANYCAVNKIRVGYALPWRFAPANDVARSQKVNRRFLAEVNEFLPVLQDETWGVYADAGQYADTCWHLDGAGALHRTTVLARAVKDWRVYGVRELKQE